MDRLPIARNAALLLVLAIMIGTAAVWIALSAGARRSSEARLRFLPLTSSPGNEVDPALSPDGTRLAYATRVAGDNVDIMIKSGMADAPIRLTSSPSIDRAPTWSPDGRHIVFARLTPLTCEMMIVPASGGPERPLGACGCRDSLKTSWSPHGGWLALSAHDPEVGGPNRLQLLDLRTLERRDLTRPPSGVVGDDMPAFSPDGYHLAFVRHLTGTVSDVFVVAVGGGELRRITSDNADVIGVDWTPDGRTLLMSSDRGGAFSLWRVDAAGGSEPLLVAGGGVKIKHPAAARHSPLVAYENWNYDINIVERAVGAPAGDHGANDKHISATTEQWNLHPQVSPDGLRIAFESTRSGSYEIWVASRTGSSPLQITSSDNFYKSPPQWSPDSRRLVFSARPGGRGRLFVIDVAHRTSSVFTKASADEVAPSWSRDGQWIYFASPRNGAWQVWKRRTDGGAELQVTHGGGYLALESPDANWVYFTRFATPGLWRVPAHGGAEQLVVSALRAEDSANWGVIEAGIFYISRPDGGDPELLLQRTAGATMSLGRLPEHAWSGVALAPDGRSIFYARADRRESNIIGLEFLK